MKPAFDPVRATETFLESLGYSLPEAVTALPGGRNNRVWRVGCGKRTFLLKHYFWSEQDPRDRLGQEWAFLQYLHQTGCRQAPEPFRNDPSTRSALLEFIEGVPVEIPDVSTQDVHAAAEFFLQINARRREGESLMSASEACFSIGTHLNTLAERVDRLRTIGPETAVHAAARDFVDRSVRPLFAQVESRIRCGSDLSHNLTNDERCLSPSDFGFHNSLRQSDGCLRFFDFEYAGWDDPAKTIIDFCNQPDRLLPDDLSRIFRERALEAFPDPEYLSIRIRLLEPLYQLKWACICLNNFLPGREFDAARPDRSPEAQLARARVMADRAAMRFESEE